MLYMCRHPALYVYSYCCVSSHDYTYIHKCGAPVCGALYLKYIYLASSYCCICVLDAYVLYVSSSSQSVRARCASVGCSGIYVSSYCCICVFMLLYVCPHTAIYVSSFYYMCPHTGVSLSSYCCTCVLMLLYMCPHTATCVLILLYVSSYCYTCVLIRLYTHIRDALAYGAPFTMCVLIMLYVSSYYIYCKYAAEALIEQDADARLLDPAHTLSIQRTLFYDLYMCVLILTYIL